MEKPCYHSCGHIFDSIIIKLGQDACLGTKKVIARVKNKFVGLFGFFLFLRHVNT
jgi:hypothetical protein